MANEQYPPRVALTTLKEVNSKYGGFVLLGTIGMSEVVIQKTKAGDKWVVYLQEKRDNKRPPQRSQAPARLERPAYAPPQRQAAPPQEEAPWPENDDGINF